MVDKIWFGLFSLFGWRHPAMGIQSMAGVGMDLTQAAYRYNHNMMEYYTCKKSCKTGSTLKRRNALAFFTSALTRFFVALEMIV